MHRSASVNPPGRMSFHLHDFWGSWSPKGRGGSDGRRRSSERTLELPDRNADYPPNVGVQREAQRNAALVNANLAARRMNRRGAETESGFGDEFYADAMSPVGVMPRTVSKAVSTLRFATALQRPRPRPRPSLKVKGKRQNAAPIQHRSHSRPIFHLRSSNFDSYSASLRLVPDSGRRLHAGSADQYGAWVEPRPPRWNEGRVVDSSTEAHPAVGQRVCLLLLPRWAAMKASLSAASSMILVVGFPAP